MRQQTFVNGKPTLYLVATPIGNLSEFTPRAIEVLKSVNVIGCEDTRTSKVLLNHFEIETPLLSYHKFNEKESVERFLTILDEGHDIALIHEDDQEDLDWTLCEIGRYFVHLSVGS